MVRLPPHRRRGNTYGKSSHRLRPIQERHRLEGLVTHPIVTEEEFELVQRRLQDNQLFAFRDTRHREYLLRGLIRCTHCGRIYGGLTRNGRQYYYCRGRWDAAWGVEKCSSKTLRADVIEEAVYGMVTDFLKGPEGFLAEVR